MTANLTLVTGGAGFLGRHVVDCLLAGGCPVRVLDRQPDDRQSGAEWVLGSVTDEQTVASACNGVARIIHLAAIPHLWSSDMQDFARVNHTGTQMMLDAAKAQEVSAFVHVSSLTTRIAGAGGGVPRTVTEADLPDVEDMLGAYPRSKWLAEAAARQAYDDGLPVRIAIPTMPLGPGDIGLTPPSQMVLDFVSGRTPAYLETWMNIADARDMAASIVAMLDIDVPRHGLFLGGENLQLSDLLQRLEAVSGVAMPRSKVPGFVAQAFAYADEFVATRLTGKPPKAPLTGVKLARRPIQFDMQAARKFLPSPRHSLDETLSDLLNWFEAEGLWSGRKG
ncbi:NAD-dependent epimerase/dehydratase family protein [Pyruvatibacter sp. HU-CL02332]|uniref:NAD-dependent epimerase/dehydratase family protein n=1 Tax=Pyruvatibacter sp. HU-CL02332 TaxID=3127650 RepID=UPI003105657F